MSETGPVRAVRPLTTASPEPVAYDRVPPHNLDAETSVLGSMLLSRDAIAEVTELVGPEDFYRGAHRTMYEAIRELYDRGEPVDPVTLADGLEHRGTLDSVGGAAGIADLIAQVPTAANALYYARIVADHALRRRLIDAGTQITRFGYAAEEGADEAVDAAEALIYQVAQRGYASEFTPMKDLLNASFELIERLHENNSAITGLATGFIDFDELTAGLQPANLIVIAARPAMGKSTLVTNVATHVAVELRRPAVMFSLEMSQMELVQRILAGEARVDSERLRTGRLRESDWPKLSQAMGRLAEAPLFIDETPGINLMEIRSKCRRLKQRHGLDLVIVDYLQLMQSHRRVENRVQEVSELSRGLKILAKELDVPVIALSQLSRRPEERTDRRPQLADLRESGCLTADARVLRADTGAEVTIGELFRTGERNVPVWTLTPDLTVARAVLTHTFSSGVKKVFRLSLDSGREVKASANHPFRTVAGWRRLDELTEGSRVAVPRTLPEPDAATAWADEELILLAHLIGDGCIASGQPIHYTSADLKNIATVEQAATYFGVAPRRVRQGNSWHTYLPSPHRLARGSHNPIVYWLDRMGLYGKRSREKFIPAPVFGLKRPPLALFLRHLWATGGHMSRRDRLINLYYASSSRRLIDGLQLLLLRFGIQSRIRQVEKAGCASTFQLWITGATSQLAFLDEIGIHGARGEKAVEFATSPGRLSPAAGALSDSQLGAFAASEVLWDTVRSIEPLGEQEVFDATVRGTHNFIANGIAVHNSIEQDADVVAFIYRDEVYHPDSAAKGEAELIVAKHRNGPLRTVPLSFIGHHSRFASMARGPLPPSVRPVGDGPL